MHKLNVNLQGPDSFINTLNEIRHFLKFNLSRKEKDVIIYHYDYLKDRDVKNEIKKENCIKILATSKNDKLNNLFDNYIELPATIKEINEVVEKSSSKKKFIDNSSIKIKDYILDKNERMLSNKKNKVVLTEKETLLLELLVSNKKPITKNLILSEVWRYAADADTHTVETHIYRLRKKINDVFSDEKFILNNKEGYYI